jgi:hypothetical protein
LKRLSTSRFFPLCSWDSGVEKAHGRIERRVIDVLPAEAAGIQCEWPTVRRICRIRRWRQIKKNGEWQPPQHEVVHLISSLTAATSPQALLRINRNHWGIGVSNEGHAVMSVKVRPEPKDSGFEAREAPWRESKAAEPSDNILERSMREASGCNVQ